MKINSINTTTPRQNFKGSSLDVVSKFMGKHPEAIIGLAGSSVIMQKIVMSGAEATIGPVMDIAIGKTITKATGEKDGRTNQSSKTQAIRTSAQAIGGTITGVIIRGICIAATTALLMKAGKNTGSKVAKTLTSNGKVSPDNVYEFTNRMQSWGKNVGGAAAVAVMAVTNFVIDAPFINMINKKMTNIFDKKPETPSDTNSAKAPKPQIATASAENKEAKEVK